MAQKKIDIALTITEAQHLEKAIADAQNLHVVAFDRKSAALNRAQNKLTKAIALYESDDLEPVKPAEDAVE